MGKMAGKVREFNRAGSLVGRVPSCCFSSGDCFIICFMTPHKKFRVSSPRFMKTYVTCQVSKVLNSKYSVFVIVVKSLPCLPLEICLSEYV